MIRSDISRKDRDKFETHYIQGTPEECWNWNSYPSNTYPKFRLKDRLFYCSRISYCLYYGDFKENLDVLHRCDNPNCVNSYHLFLGNHQDNMRDRGNKGRLVANSTSYIEILTVNEKMKIKQLYKSGGFSQRQIARDFSISQALVFNVIHDRI